MIPERDLEPVGDEFRPVDAGHLEQLEKTARVRLPQSWINLLSRHGSCGFRGAAFVLCPNGRRFPIFVFFGGPEARDQILADLELHPEFEVAGVIPVADDEFNNRYVWDRRTGVVSFIDYSHGAAEWAMVAESFDAFLDRIEVSADGD